MPSLSLVVLRILGVVVAAVGGAAEGLLVSYSWVPGESRGLVEILLAGMVAVVSGALLRTWWALLAVPLVFLAGAVAANWYTDSIATQRLGEPMSVSAHLTDAGLVLLVGVLTFGLPLIVGAVIGTSTGKWLAEQAMYRRVSQG
jgi:hypothetical protein